MVNYLNRKDVLASLTFSTFCFFINQKHLHQILRMITRCLWVSSFHKKGGQQTRETVSLMYMFVLQREGCPYLPDEECSVRVWRPLPMDNKPLTVTDNSCKMPVSNTTVLEQLFCSLFQEIGKQRVSKDSVGDLIRL